ncbi:MAG: hypothetical protein HYV63_07015 [Candidatus Schekmanbacteria bacterium]|nr:hypothetical protein [Candidatus Schekmanbacteria bacterium]
MRLTPVLAALLAAASATGCSGTDTTDALHAGSPAVPVAAAAVSLSPQNAAPTSPATPAAPPAPAAPRPPLKAAIAPPPDNVPRTPHNDVPELTRPILDYFTGQAGRRFYIQIDKPLYRAGETIWIKTWDLRVRDLDGQGAGSGVRYRLISPKGAIVLEKWVQQDRGLATNDFELPPGVPGGEYRIAVIADNGQQAERPVMVSSYEPPRLKKKLELLRKAYGPGDEVTASVEVRKPTGEPLVNHALRVNAWLDGQDLPAFELATDRDGAAVVRFSLPARIEKGDGLLTVLADEGGVTESISKRIPIVLNKIQLSFYPEGGKLVEGVATRLYFEARTPLGKPADVEGRLMDDHGNAVATFQTYHHGLGRVDFTPATGRRYHAEITRPIGIAERFALPLAEADGCVIGAYDDLDGELSELRVRIACTQARTVLLVATLRENLLDAARLTVASGQPAIVYLTPADQQLARRQGIARVTLFDEQKQPLAERLVYRNRRQRLQVEVKADRDRHAPRDQVTLAITTREAPDRPVPAELAVSVVDDTVVSFADDKTGHILSRLYLEPEIPGEVEEPNVYFDLAEPKSALAMDLLMGTRGWRRFDWMPVFSPQPRLAGTGGPADFGMEDGVPGAAGPRRPNPAVRKRAVEEERPLPPANPLPKPGDPAARAGEKADQPLDRLEKQAAEEVAMPAAVSPPVIALMPREAFMRGDNAGADKDWAAAEKLQAEPRFAGWAPVRVFPAPSYSSVHQGSRTDFRDTIHWAPRVVTGEDGKGSVSFFLSDAVTSFRVFTEGVGAGAAGRDETVLSSSLPFSMAVKLPAEVSAGDHIDLPITLTNNGEEPLAVTFTADLGKMLQPASPLPAGAITLGAAASTSLFLPLAVTGTRGSSPVAFAAAAAGLRDELSREIRVAPPGFPIEQARSGSVAGSVVHSFALGSAIPGTVTARVTLYPSPVATMLSGLDGLLRQPSGCFEQASSANYPNVMIMSYLQQHRAGDPELIARSQALLEDGYRKLAGYETSDKGYEWFGSAPGHEALTAYGLLEFRDMKAVYDGVEPAMMARTASWLLSRRDGEGGYRRNPKALDSFGAASAGVTDAYITWALVGSGHLEPGVETERQRRLARETGDPYLLALAAGTLLQVESARAEGLAAVDRLQAMQDQGGSWKGAAESITRSGGSNLEIETTALALLALLQAERGEEAVRRGVQWLEQNRGGFGQWGATQATVLALKALTLYADRSRVAASDGAVTVMINGNEVGRQEYRAGRREPLVFDDLGGHFGAGGNRLEIRHEGQSPLPYAVAVESRSALPASSPEAVVDLQVALARATLELGEAVRLTATVTNKTRAGQPMTLARIGLPGGLSFQTWQLKELREKNLIAFFETQPREVILYFRDLKPQEVKEIPIDLVATVPGTYTGPASSAYLYYTDEHKTWVEGVKVQITH